VTGGARSARRRDRSADNHSIDTPEHVPMARPGPRRETGWWAHWISTGPVSDRDECCAVLQPPRVPYQPHPPFPPKGRRRGNTPAAPGSKDLVPWMKGPLDSMWPAGARRLMVPRLSNQFGDASRDTPKPVDARPHLQVPDRGRGRAIGASMSNGLNGRNHEAQSRCCEGCGHHKQRITRA